MVEVLVAGAGPAGSVAATVLARAGVRVLVVERARFPRDKLCGDTVSPGSLAVLRRLGLADAVERAGVAFDGMLVTTGPGFSVEGRYGGSLTGRALPRRELDALLLDAARAAGARIEFDARVIAPMLDGSGRGRRVRGVVVRARGREIRIPAVVTIAADGRRSVLARALGLATTPRWPRRWGVGAYFAGVEGTGSLGEMHLRAAHYIGVAPMPGGLVNACLVTPARPELRDPPGCLTGALAGDPVLAPRFAGARRVSDVMTLGPLASDARGVGVPGLVLAGDSAGFIDPMTGDGVRFAVEGGALAARAALEWLEDPGAPALRRLAARRARGFGPKRAFDRVLRAAVAPDGTAAVSIAAAPLVPGVVRFIVRTAGDERLARRLGREGRGAS